MQQTSIPKSFTCLTICKTRSNSASSLTSLQAAPMQNLLDPDSFACFAAAITVGTSRSFSISISALYLADCGQ